MLACRQPLKVYNGFFLQCFANDYMKQMLEFEVREDDILIACFPKCGTTWLQKVVHMVIHGPDYDDPAGVTMEDRVPYMEHFYPGLENIKARTGQRILKSHLPYSLLPPQVQKGKAKVITIARNPKDVVVSYYHFARMNANIEYQGDFNSFYQLFIKGQVTNGPYPEYLAEYWQHRHDDNILFLFYEDLKMDLQGSVKQVATFLQCELSDKQLEEIVNRSTFNSMKKDPTCNYDWWDEQGRRKQDESKFMRKGEIGDWKNYLTSEMSAEIEKLYEPLKEMGLQFKYEI